MFNSKVVLLFLLTSLSLNGFAHSKNESCDCDEKERTHCRQSCCKPKERKKANCCDQKITKKNCHVEHEALAYECCLAFEKVVGLTNGAPKARPVADKPQGVCGNFKICFAEDRSEALYELTITGLNTHKFPNQQPLGAALYYGSATNAPFDGNRIAYLCGLTNDGSTCAAPNGFCSSSKKEDFCCKVILTNENLNPNILFSAGGLESATIPTISALLEAIRAGKVFIVVNGGNTCDTNATAPKYGLGFPDDTISGMLRCQLSGEEVAGVTTNGGFD